MNYEERLKISIQGNKETNFYTFSGLKLATGYERIVIGKRGPYIEFIDDQIVLVNLYIPEAEAYRKSYSAVYYIEYRSIDDCNVKVYYQKKTVDYADYKIGFWYISPFDLKTDEYSKIIEKLR